MLNCCIDTQHTHKISMTEKKKHRKQSKKSKLFPLTHSLTLVLRKIALMTVNNYGSIFVKIDRNVLMLNEFFALSAYVLLIRRKIRHEFNVLKIRSKYTHTHRRRKIVFVVVVIGINI
jgi:hypothetical protein